MATTSDDVRTAGNTCTEDDIKTQIAVKAVAAENNYTGETALSAAVTVSEPYSPPPSIPPYQPVKEDVVKESQTGKVKISTSELRQAETLTVNAATDAGKVTIAFDSAALEKIGDDKPLDITVEALDNEDTANFLIDNGNVRAAFDISAFLGNEQLSDFGEGTLTIVLPYVPAEGEDISRLAIYHIDDEGNSAKIAGAYYNAEKGGLVFTINHLSIYAIVSETFKFTDVDDSSWSAEYIYYLVNLGAAGGVGDNKFEPQRSITRAEFVKMLAITVGADLTRYSGSSFNDVAADIWYAPYVEWAYQNGITNGDGNNMFSPDKLITRQDLATMIYRFTGLFGYSLPQAENVIIFTDESTFADYARPAILALRQAGIIGGKLNTDQTYRFDPLSSASREETCKMLAILHQILFK